MFIPMLLVFAASIEITPQDDLFATLQTLQAGDEVIVHAGDYDVPGYVAFTLPGSEAQPIVIRAADGAKPVIHGIDSQNTLNVSGSWYTLRGLTIDGGSHGIRVGNSAHAILEDLEIYATADVGISCNLPANTYEDITIRRNHIHDTGMGGGPGEGMYLGCNDGDCVMWDSLIEFNWVHDTAQGEQGDGIEFKTGSYNTVVRHNVVYNTKYPGITLYGTQGKAPNLVEGNIVWNAQDNGIQTVGDITVRNNIVLDSGASGIGSKGSQGEQVVNLTIVHNTVIGAGDVCLRGNNFDAGDSITIANNALYCEGGTAIKLPQGAGPAVFAGNAVVGGIEGPAGGTFDGASVAAAFTDAAAKDVYPGAGSPLVDAGDPAHAPALDFNCLPRAGTPDVGAYDVSAPGNPGWQVQGGFKVCDGDDPDPGTTTTPDDDTGDPSDSDPSTSDTSAGETSGDDPSVDVTGDETATPPGTDDGDDLPTGIGPTTGAGEDTAAPTAPISPTVDSNETEEGCSCTSTPQGAPALALLTGLAVLLPIRRRRRR